MIRPPLPPFSEGSPIQKVRAAEDAWKGTSRLTKPNYGIAPCWNCEPSPHDLHQMAFRKLGAVHPTFHGWGLR